MTDAVTYTLAPGTGNSEEYYKRIGEFTDEVLERTNAVLMPGVREFTDYLRRNELEEIRSDEEYMLELLSFGLLWKTYGGYSHAVRIAPFITLSRMAEWRKKHQQWKPAIDITRGILVTLFLLPRRGRKPVTSTPSLQDVDRLNRWLEATGEFREQALRFVRWRSYFESMSRTQWNEASSLLSNLVEWFAERAEHVLGEYTANVEAFLDKSADRYLWREDRVQCTRSRAEYHLNMVGAEIMNRAFRSDFVSTEAKALLVPGCMRARDEKECEATRVKEGLRCMGCVPRCNVNRLREMGKKQGYDTFIIPHASDLSLWAPKPNQPRRGVVAVACVTTLVEGGWELKRYGVCAQCVLLDFSGCKKHWHCEGVPTTINLQELKRKLGTEKNAA